MHKDTCYIQFGTIEQSRDVCTAFTFSSGAVCIESQSIRSVPFDWVGKALAASDKCADFSGLLLLKEGLKLCQLYIPANDKMSGWRLQSEACG